MSAPAVLIVGSGPAGLAAAAQLRRRKVAAVILEQGDAVATAWTGRYDRLRLNTCRWTSKLPHSRYPRRAGLFPSRDQVVDYLSDYARRNELDVRVGIRVERISRDDGGWALETSAGRQTAPQVILATGHQHTPAIPAWPGRERWRGPLLHVAQYRNATPFEGADVLVVGAGCSGMEIAYDLVEGGAGRVRIAVRTQPNIMLRQSGGLPGDLPAIGLMRLPTRIADAVARLARRLTIGDLSAYGLIPPAEGVFTLSHRLGRAPAIVDKSVIQAIRDRRIEVAAAIQSLDELSVVLADGTQIAPDAIIAATGYTSHLEPLVGHLGVLDERALPRVHGGPAVAPGLRFIGYQPRPAQIGYVGTEATRAAKQIKRELRSRRRRQAATAPAALEAGDPRRNDDVLPREPIIPNGRRLTMHAMVFRVKIHDRQQADKVLHEQFVPGMSSAPGFVGAYWVHTGENTGTSVIVFESEDAVKACAQAAPQAPSSALTVESFETGEVVAHA
jgi:cation diffusion facilitator CzcD-associated flavoprotein CzcO